MDLNTYTGGFAETNAFLISSGGEHWLIDAPEGAADFLEEKGVQLNGLILTHGHWDHIWDAAAIIEKHGCPCIGHPDDRTLFEDPNQMARFGLPIDLDSVDVSRYINEGENLQAGDISFDILHLPGHCPGSIGLHDKESRVLFGGDVLFAGGVGRWDLPGGDFRVLMQSTREKVLTLPDETLVYPGHGPSTTVGEEKRTNPFLNRPDR